MKKVFRVTCEFEFFVSADDDDDAWTVARNSYREAVRDADTPDMLFTSEVSDIKSVPKDWRNCYPYRKRGEPEETIEQMLGAASS